MNTNGWNDFIDVCLSADNKLRDDLFDLFFTAEEKADLTTRFLIIKELLKKEKPQRQIAKDLHVSIAKITRGSNELKRMNPKVLAYLLSKL